MDKTEELQKIMAWAHTVLVHRINTDDTVGQNALKSLADACDGDELDEIYTERSRLANELSFMFMELSDERAKTKRLEDMVAELQETLRLGERLNQR